MNASEAKGRLSTCISELYEIVRDIDETSRIGAFARIEYQLRDVADALIDCKDTLANIVDNRKWEDPSDY
jgi:hypothetical protein